MARFQLVRDENGYGLKDVLSNPRALVIDFLSPQMHHRRAHGGKKELLLKAVNARTGLEVWDCTAGLGTDSFLLAAAGGDVTMFERSAVLSILLEQALLSLKKSGELQQVSNRMRCVREDSISFLKQARQPPDVILIDPMFPARTKSAQVKGEMQILQRFLSKDENARELLRLAIDSGVPRVVLKQPATGTGVPGFEPDFSLSAKANRFDVYLN